MRVLRPGLEPRVTVQTLKNIALIHCTIALVDMNRKKKNINATFENVLTHRPTIKQRG